MCVCVCVCMHSYDPVFKVFAAAAAGALVLNNALPAK